MIRLWSDKNWNREFMLCIEMWSKDFMFYHFSIWSVIIPICHQSVIVSICNYFEVLSLLQLGCHQTKEFSIQHFCKDQLVIQTLECNKWYVILNIRSCTSMYHENIFVQRRARHFWIATRPSEECRTNFQSDKRNNTSRTTGRKVRHLI